jgi:hypothetical protein
VCAKGSRADLRAKIGLAGAGAGGDAPHISVAIRTKTGIEGRISASRFSGRGWSLAILPGGAPPASFPHRTAWGRRSTASPA